MTRTLSIFGATGSVGLSTLDLVRQHREQYRVVALTANGNAADLAKLAREFEPEMGRIHVARISGADGDRGKIERVRVYGGDNRDHYGSKLK